MKHNTRHWVGITVGILSLAGYASAATRGSEKYTYDASGNIIEKSIDGKVTKMSFDRSNRLIERQTAGQGRQSTAYDAAGRPVTERNADGQTTRSMSYGYGDKVLETQTQDSKTEFYYNAGGLLVGKKGDSRVLTYTWDGIALAAQDNLAYANETHIAGGVPVLTGGIEVVVCDHLGSTLLQGRRSFSSTIYGEGQEEGRFTTKTFVEELGGYLFPERIYSAATCKWNSPDPIGYPNSCNSYSYLTDPFSGVDPMGTEVQLWALNANGIDTQYNTARCSNEGFELDGTTKTYPATLTEWSTSSYSENKVVATPTSLTYTIIGEGATLWDALTSKYDEYPKEDVDYCLTIGVDEYDKTFLPPAPVHSPKIVTSPMSAGVNADVDGVLTKRLTITAAMAVAHKGVNITGVGLAKAAIAWESTTSEAKPYGLWSWTWKSEQ